MLAAAGAGIQDVVGNDIRRNGMPVIFVDRSDQETDRLEFLWHGGDDKGRAAAFSVWLNRIRRGCSGNDASLLFLDFDGTLHPEPCYRDGSLCRRPLFEAVIREAPDVEIVITSTWRDTRDLATLRGFFSNDIAARVIGVTPSWQDLPETRRRDQADVCPAN